MMLLDIVIEGNLSKIDSNSLHKKLTQIIDSTLVKIDFKDTQYLPYIIVKDLLKLKNQLQISTNKKSLYLYLINLGINNKYKFQYQLQNINKVKNIKAIGIGGSAGSIKMLIEIIKTLPYFDISIFITLHILPDKESLISKILEELTQYKVQEAIDNSIVQKNTIYIAPPNKHLLVVNGYIQLSTAKRVNYSRPSINMMFDSLAYEYKDSLLAILLCGYGNDGSDSIQTLTKYKSEIIIQNPNECEANDMLINAINAGANTNIQVFDLKDIQNYLNIKLSSLISVKNDIIDFLEKIYEVYGYDYRNYEIKSITRRIEFIMIQTSAKDLMHFKQMVLKDQDTFNKLKNAFSINVTTFFRNPLVFKKLQNELLPTLKKEKYLRVWCAGCSRGDEPYSIAIMLKEAGLLQNSQIYATDFNETIINEATNGIYSEELFNEFEENYLQTGGKQKFENYFNIENEYFEIKQEIKDKILFFGHNLAVDSSINEFHIIFCRNVLIYFNDTLKERVFKLIDTSLSKNGYLILGESESVLNILNYKNLSQKKVKVYQKI